MVPKKRIINNVEVISGECVDCLTIKSINEFDVSTKINDKIYYRNRCHICFLSLRTKYRKENNQQNIIYKINNKDVLLEYNKKYYINNKDKCQKLNKKNYIKYKEEGRLLKYSRKHAEKNREKINSSARTFYKKKRKEDIGFRINSDISRAIRSYLTKNGGSKNNKSCKKYLSFNFQELKLHLESLFESWMNWNNRGKYNSKTWDDNNILTWTWNIDHIIPQSKLPYISMEDDNFKKCWALENLRPLSAKQNIIDGDRR